MTLTQLGAFVLVARLGSVRAAATALGVSEPAVSQALASLRRHLGDDLVVRGDAGMTLTAGGRRLVAIASQMVALGAEAEAAVRAAQGAPERLRVVADSEVAEFVAPSLLEAFAARTGGVEATVGVASRDEMCALLTERMADVALGPSLAGEVAPGVDSRPVMRCQLVVVGAAAGVGNGAAGRDSDGRGGRLRWLVGPSGTDPASPAGALIARRGVHPGAVRVFPSQAAAWAAAADGQGVAPALAHLVAPELRRGRLRIVEAPGTPAAVHWHVSTLGGDRRSVAASSFRHFVGTAQAMQLMHRPGQGVPPNRFRPPVYVTIWS